LLLTLAGWTDIAEVYKGALPGAASTGNIERYLVAHLGLSTGMQDAKAFYDALETLLSVADEYGRRVRADAEEEVEAMQIELANSSTSISGKEFLEGAWPTLLAIYRGLAALDLEERDEPLIVRCVVVPLRCADPGPPEIDNFKRVAAYHDGAVFRRLTPAEAYWDVAPSLALSPAAEWALSQFYPEDLRAFFIDLGVCPTLDQAVLSRRLETIAQQSVRGGYNQAAPRSYHTRPSVNGNGLSAVDLVGTSAASSLRSARNGGSNDPLEAAAAVLAELRAERSPTVAAQRDLSAPGQRAMNIELPARAARSLRLRPKPPRRLQPRGVLAISRAEFVSVLAQPDIAGVERLVEGRAMQSFARLLARLATVVFDVPLSCLAIVVEMSEERGDCGFLGFGDPLLFSWNLFERIQDPSYWFGEFCHALAHRAVGEGHLCSSHATAMQALFAWHLPAFVRIQDW